MQQKHQKATYDSCVDFETIKAFQQINENYIRFALILSLICTLSSASSDQQKIHLKYDSSNVV